MTGMVGLHEKESLTTNHPADGILMIFKKTSTTKCEFRCWNSEGSLQNFTTLYEQVFR